MTRRAFQLWLALIAGLYATFIVAGVLLHDGDYYDLYKDLVPLATALPAAVLAGVYQRRSSFLQQLRSTWRDLVVAVQEAIQFTHIAQPTTEQFSDLMKKLSVVTDDFRSLFRNLDERTDSIGLYPFESLKELQASVSSYYIAADFSTQQQQTVRRKVIQLWKQVRTPIVEEFDRLEPTHFDTPFRPGGTAAQQGASPDRQPAARSGGE